MAGKYGVSELIKVSNLALDAEMVIEKVIVNPKNIVGLIGSLWSLVQEYQVSQIDGAELEAEVSELDEDDRDAYMAALAQKAPVGSSDLFNKVKKGLGILALYVVATEQAIALVKGE